ncbi:hypothetical protein [Actinomadura sp. DC4]|uniref:hypothetical protein n=1 Tax=Actinomadura sp. DC4 TaxID=3055069 RepID=UPI0025B08826|nr:hypothetical protein [Actinomadura sp. DC4]MDN3356098.1 hypothetical protein [Actinomadura sp. DC4]
MKLFGRDPVVIAALLSAALQAINMFWLHLTSDQTAAVNAAIGILLAALAAAFVSVDALLPLLSGVAQAIVNVVLVFGVHWSADQVGSITALVAAFVAIVGVRPQVTARVAPDGSLVPRQSLFRLAA